MEALCSDSILVSEKLRVLFLYAYVFWPYPSLGLDFCLHKVIMIVFDEIKFGVSSIFILFFPITCKISPSIVRS